MARLVRTFIGKACAFVHDQSGPTATEYAVMLSLILMTAIGAIGIFGGSLGNLFVDIESSLFAA
jgi:Flp pilus assembly pilin Flp